MKPQSNTSIDKKLGVIFHKAIVFCLAVTSVGFAATILYYSGLTFTQELSSVANIAAATSRASLVFDDPRAGERVLSGLHAKPSIIFAGLFKPDGTLVSEYGQIPPNVDSSSIGNSEEFRWSWTSVLISVPVRLDNDYIGYLIVVSSLDTLYQQLALSLGIAALIMFIAAIGAGYFRAILRRLVSEPIVSLRDMAVRVTLTKDFSTRMPDSRKERDEVSELISSFNEMLSQLDERNHALVFAKNRAEEADRLKSIFLATVSHELRTPLHAILGITGELQETQVTTEQKELLEIVSTSGTLLISIINDILDFSKIEAGKLVLLPTDVVLEELLLKVVMMFELQTRKKGIDLSFSVEPSVPKSIRIDGSRLTQVLVNLVANAIKFTSSGSIIITVKQIPEKSRTGFLNLHFAVADTGIGIEEGALQSIFDSFTQIRKPGDPQEGTGLGLAIASKLVVLMGGSIWVESQLGSGSTFHFSVEVPALSIPLKIERALSENARSKPPANVDISISAGKSKVPQIAATILVVEDNKVNSLLAQRVLSKAGYRVLLAYNGQECLDMLTKEKVDLILMDLNMPIMDGLEATKKIRESEISTGGHIQIIALTANALDDRASECLAAGMDEFLTKPLDGAKLLASISKHLLERSKSGKLVSVPLEGARTIQESKI